MRSPTGFLVAAAAKLVAEHRVDALVDELVVAFDRLLVDGARRDPMCRGKLAIVAALSELDQWHDRVFVAGLRHNQDQGAAELRGRCGIAHAQFRRPDALDVLATLLGDGEAGTRIVAARGLGDSGHVGASAVLRLKILVGDDEPEVIGSALESLLAIAPDASFDFVVGLLAADAHTAEAAALALGATRNADAVPPLIDYCNGCSPKQRQNIAYLALALTRADAAIDHLLDAIRHGPKDDALAAARALATFRDDRSTADRIRAAAADRTKPPPLEDEIDGLLR